MAGRSPDLIDLTDHTFTPDRTRPVAEAACRQVGLDPVGAVLLRHQTNAVYRLLSRPVVIKVARPGEQHLAEVVKLVSWLSKHEVPSVALWDEANQPLEVAGCAVTLWRYLPQARPIKATTCDQVSFTAMPSTATPCGTRSPVTQFCAIGRALPSSNQNET